MKIGILATIALLSFYFIIMTLLGWWEAAILQFRALWYLMVPVAIGFGIQVGLYAKQSKKILATTGTTSSISMLACCAHHATDVLPLIGLSGLSFFLLQYQIPILTISLGINIIGIFVMLKHVKMVSL